jgi:hypothetical protein
MAKGESVGAPWPVPYLEREAMFADAIQLAMQFTKPVIISRRAFDGKCSTSIGTYVPLNADGWVVTASHIIEQLAALEASQQDLIEYEGKRDEIQNDDKLQAKARKKALRKLGGADGLTRNHSIWWGRDDLRVAEVVARKAVDFAIARLEPGFSNGFVTAYPAIKDPTKPMRVGTSLCRLGYPFSAITPNYDETTDKFHLPGGSPPYFPLEGIFTREIRLLGKDGEELGKWLETSSAGLKGQSGGPIFDVNGTVWAIQSKTTPHPLGFEPKAKGDGGRTVTEHQFLNLGTGVHAETLVSFLDDNGVDYQLADY